METKRVVTEEDMKRFRKYGDCLRWLGQGYIDCPECGQKMVERTGPHGRVLACENPECNHVKQISGTPEE